MENKIVPGSFVDKLLSDYLNIPQKKYSTDIKEGLLLLDKFVEINRYFAFNIDFKKQLNSQNCKITLNMNDIDYEAEGGYISITICLLFINSWSKHLKFYSFECLKKKYERYKAIQNMIEEEGFTDELLDEETELDLHPDIPTLFQKLDDHQIEALVEYANRE